MKRIHCHTKSKIYFTKPKICLTKLSVLLSLEKSLLKKVESMRSRKSIVLSLTCSDQNGIWRSIMEISKDLLKRLEEMHHTILWGFLSVLNKTCKNSLRKVQNSLSGVNTGWKLFSRINPQFIDGYFDRGERLSRISKLLKKPQDTQNKQLFLEVPK